MRTNRTQTPTTPLRYLLDPLSQDTVEQHAVIVMVGELLPIHRHVNSSTLPLLNASVLSDIVEHKEHLVCLHLVSSGL